MRGRNDTAWSWPKDIYVYVCDREEDGDPILAVAKYPDEIPTNIDGEEVGLYQFTGKGKFKVNPTVVKEGR